MKLINRPIERSVGSCYCKKDILVQLELSWNVDGDVSTLFECKVLCFVEHTEVVNHGLVLVSKLVFINVTV